MTIKIIKSIGTYLHVFGGSSSVFVLLHSSNHLLPTTLLHCNKLVCCIVSAVSGGRDDVGVARGRRCGGGSPR